MTRYRVYKVDLWNHTSRSCSLLNSCSQTKYPFYFLNHLCHLPLHVPFLSLCFSTHHPFFSPSKVIIFHFSISDVTTLPSGRFKSQKAGISLKRFLRIISKFNATFLFGESDIFTSGTPISWTSAGLISLSFWIPSVNRRVYMNYSTKFPMSTVNRTMNGTRSSFSKVNDGSNQTRLTIFIMKGNRPLLSRYRKELGWHSNSPTLPLSKV